MLRNIVIGMIALIGSSAIVFADAKQEVLAAAKKLAESDNYSWTTIAEGAGGFVGGGSEGKTRNDGLTLLVLNLRDGSAQVIFKGDKGAFRTPDEGWQAIGAENADQGGPGRMIANMIRTYQPPAQQALNLASKAQDLQKTDDGYSGTLSAEDAKALMQRRIGRRQGADAGAGPEFADAKCAVRFWTSNDMLTKFQFTIEGTMSIQGEQRQINRTTTVQIKDVGTTTIDVPPEAKEKMG